MRTVVFFFALLLAVTVNAATAHIENVWLEHGLNMGGKNAMKVHCKFTIDNALNQNCSMGVWVKDSSGKWLRLKSDYTANDGTKFFRQIFTPIYNSAIFNDLHLQFPTEDLNLYPGNNNYSVIVTISDPQGQILAQSEPVDFTGTSNTVNNNFNQNLSINASDRDSKPRQERVCNVCKGSGVKGYSIEGPAARNCIESIVGYRNYKDARCPFCTKTNFHIHFKCSNCDGTGYKIY